ncbi:MAG: O-antigen ligase family protein [Sedimentisphaerales bacterium]|nr:O-antigen ligase family protein [Sedimentisphaerales bacterium]
MSIRITALYFLILSLSIYAWKDWFKSLCGLILLMAVIEHPDMPKNLFGIQGLNPWNVLFGVIFLAWLVSRVRDGLRWDMPRYIAVLLLIYISVIVAGVLRAFFDPGYFAEYPLKSLISEELINTIKWMIPGILLFDGCRTRKQAVMALVCLLVLYFLICLQVAKHVPPSAIFSDSGNVEVLRNRIKKMVGYHPNEVAAILGGAYWGFIALLPLIPRKIFKIAVLIAACLIIYALALTGGRTGYAAWGLTGLILCLIKWRKYLILAPIVVILLPVIFPGATQRMLEGFGQVNVSGETIANEDEITAGRTVAWPYVIDKISESSLTGYGRLAMRRTGLYDRIEADHPGTGTPHPHNMYLETLLDNGLIGSLPILLFWAIVVIHSARLFRSSNRLCSAIGGLSLALTLNWLIAGIGSQHVYPEEFTFGMWVTLFLMSRVYLEEKKAHRTAIIAQGYEITHQSFDESMAVIQTYEK